jgi:hypothetical protein
MMIFNRQNGKIGLGIWRGLFLLLVALAFNAFGTSQAFAAEQRIALVIGNADYESIGSLSNPVKDARLIRQTLESLKFEVVYRENVSRDEMQRAISVFSDKITRAGSEGIALFYYAGHGVQSNGENFLLPTDLLIQRESELRFAAIRVNDVMAQMDGASTGIKIAILDACRDNPFGSRLGGGKAGGGLAEVGLGNSEFFVAFAATAGNTADDGNTTNSPYALALARRLPTLDSELSNTFRLVRIDVSAATGNKQFPEARTTMRREFYFAGERKTAKEDQPMLSQIPLSDTVVANPQDLAGIWCEAGRGAGVKLGVADNALSFLISGQKIQYNIDAVTALPNGRVQLVWRDRNGPVTFEFGEFDSRRARMTQLRGRKGNDGEWKDYNVRYKRCS